MTMRPSDHEEAWATDTLPRSGGAVGSCGDVVVGTLGGADVKGPLQVSSPVTNFPRVGFLVPSGRPARYATQPNRWRVLSVPSHSFLGRSKVYNFLGK